jgi:YggT family protein
MLIQIFSLILQFATGLVAGTCLLRMYMHLQRINLSVRSGNPLAPFIFAVSNWLVLPVRRYVPGIGRLDLGSLVAAYAVLLAKHALLWLMAGATAHWLTSILLAAIDLVNVALSSLMWLVIAYALASWFNVSSDARYFLAQLVEPLLRPIRRVLPHIGGVDVSPIALMLVLQIVEIVLQSVLAHLVF